MKAIHNRMPAVLEPDKFDAWLDGVGAEMLGPCRDELLTAHPVDRAVGNVRNNHPELLEPV